MSDLVVVSNRGPLSFRLGPDGRPIAAGSGGGLASSLHPLLQGSGATWVSAAMNEADRLAVDRGLMRQDGMHIVTVSPDPDTYRMAYDVIANATLWFCHHHLFDLPRRPRFDQYWQEAWTAYRAFNQLFADAVIECAPIGAVVLVQDYHLALCGAMLAETRPDLRTVHFSHTPFGDPSALRVLPTAAAGELLAGMAGFGACGFHTARWEKAFRNCFGDADLARAARIATPPATFVAPLGPDVDAIVSEASSGASMAAVETVTDVAAGRKLIVRVDRIELSKNILRGLVAYEELLVRYPQWREQVVLLTLAYASREGLADYLSYRSEIEHTAERINQSFSTDSWQPIVLDVADNRSRSVAALSLYDVLLVNPVRDGLNLVAKEGPLVNRRDGVVVLSREAGAWDELSDSTLGINPFDVTETADVLHQALSMSATERKARQQSLEASIRRRTAADWLADQIAAAGPDRTL
jgi:trehalose 6-phosphate synthase